MAELTGRPVSGDVGGMFKALLRSKLGPVPTPIVLVLGLALLIVGAVALTQFLRPPVMTLESPLAEPLRPDVGELIAISAGEFVMGGESAGALSRQVITLRTFKIDKYEVTNAQYNVFVEEAEHAAPWGTYPAERADYPVTSVDWEDAVAYCEWAGKRLPTSAEWEKAARGTAGLIYPWGNDWESSLANTKEANVGGAQAVGAYPEGASPYGVLDIAGNVWEWVEDWSGTDQTRKVIRGGAWNAIHTWAQTFNVNSVRPTETRDYIGFRCAQ